MQVGELRLHEEGGKLKFLTRLNHEIESRGIVDVLRKDIKCYPVHLTLMYATPTEKNADAAAKFACNVFSVTRQLKHRGKETSADATIMYTTRLEGEKSFFIPFNKGVGSSAQASGSGAVGSGAGARSGCFW